MSYWFVIIIPVAIMLFALFMERVETRLRNLAMRQAEVEEALEQTRPDQVRAVELPRVHRFGGRTDRLRRARAGV